MSAFLLAIDDDPVFLAFLAKVFATSDCELLTESNAQKAIQLAKDVQPRLILLDVEMPAMTGIELFEQLQKDPRTADLPVWMCSSLGDEATVAKAYRLGIADYITKPVSGVTLRAKVDRHLNRNSREIAKSKLRSAEEGLARADVHIRQLMPRVPDFPGLDIGLVYRTCDRVGGDFYDFFETAAGSHCIVIGDVTGHGVEAAVLQTMARKLIQVLVRTAPTIEEGLLLANEELRQDLPRGNFVAVVIAEWIPESRLLRFWRLGLPHPLLRGADGNVRLVMSGGTILGMHRPARFMRLLSPQDVTLQPGEMLLFHTDGGIEAIRTDSARLLKDDDSSSTNAGGDGPSGPSTELGFDGMRRIFRGVTAGTSQAMVQATSDQLLRYSERLDDDVTLLGVRALSEQELRKGSRSSTKLQAILDGAPDSASDSWESGGSSSSHTNNVRIVDTRLHRPGRPTNPPPSEDEEGRLR